MLRAWLYGLLLCGGAAAQGDAAAQDYIWWEAEAPAESNFPSSNPFAPEDAAQADALSGGAWIGGSGPRAETWYLEYEVEVPAAGAYHFYVRKFWKHGPFRWRFDGGEWQEVGRDVALLDGVELRLFVEANWVGLGTVELSAGTRRLRLELLEDDGAAAFDAFYLGRRPLVPRGRLRPEERLGRADRGYFAFEPGHDPFGPAALDLRFLNEQTAGQDGPVQVQGDGFVRGDGEALRFWGVNAGPDVWGMDRASVDYLARQLAKLGVNLVRFHGPVYDRDGGDLTRLDEKRVDRLRYAVEAMKRQGIYSGLSIYFPLWIDMASDYGFAGYDGEHPFALLFFNERFQQIYKGWWRGLLGGANPHGGVPLAAEPAVAFAELVNEDSYFFWTFRPYDTVPGPQMEILERRFGAWLAGRYGSVAAALGRWGGDPVQGDAADQGRAGLVGVWQLANQPSPRTRDTAEFLTGEQARFFGGMKAFLQDELSFVGLVSASNWITADARVLGPLDKYSNAVADFMDRHGYFGPDHRGDRAAFSLNEGDRYDDRAALLFEGAGEVPTPSFDLPIMDLAYNGKPSMISEINWPMPNAYRAEMPLLAAAYGALQGTDGLCFFALQGPSWQQMHGKFSLQTPAGMGQFPAAALAYRLGLVARGQTVFQARLGLEGLYRSEGGPVRAPQNLDLLRAGDGTLAPEEAGELDPLAFLVGPVQSSVDTAGGVDEAVDLSPYIDRTGRRVRSNTGQLEWDYGEGWVQVDAPAVQGVSGFLGRAGTVRLGAATLASTMEYGSLVLVSVDGAPLDAAERILLQVMSQERNYGWDAPGDGLRAIRDLGAPPIGVQRLSGTVELRRGDADRLRVTALDHRGYADSAWVGAGRIELLPETLYYLIEREVSSLVPEDDEGPRAFVLGQNYPNPFNGGTAIDFVLPAAGRVGLEVYNAQGQKVRTLIDGGVAAGRHRVLWDGRDQKARRLASGVYFYRLEAAGRRQTHKLVLLQ